MKAVKVFVQHQSRLYRESIFELLKATEFQRVATTAPEGGPTEEPDLVIVDLVSLRRSAEQLRNWLLGRTKVVLVADEFHLSDLCLSLQMGLVGYIPSRLSAEAFVLSLRMVMAGETVFPSELVKEILSRDFGRTAAKPHAGKDEDGDGRIEIGNGIEFRRHDLRIIDMVTSGVGNREIAGTIHITEDLVKIYIRQIMRRINVSNRTQLAIWAVQHGVVRRVPELVG